MNSPLPLTFLFAASMVAFTGNPSNAASPGTDNANQPAYDDGWQTGDNGAATGNAFSGWILTATGGVGGFAGQFIGSSADQVGGNIDVNGRSWGMFGNGAADALANATRAFDSPLTLGQTFSIDIAVNFRNGFKGLDLRDASNATIFNFNVGGDDYRVNGTGVTNTGSIGNTYSSNTVFNPAFTQDTQTGGTWAITRSGGTTDFDTGTYAGVADGFNLYIGGTTDGNPANNLFANDLSIVPEPSTWVVMLVGGLGTLVGFQRRRRSGIDTAG